MAGIHMGDNQEDNRMPFQLFHFKPSWSYGICAELEILKLTLLYWRYIGIMEKSMETTIGGMPWGVLRTDTGCMYSKLSLGFL